MKKQEKLPRGLTVRGNSVIASFALPDGTIARRSVGTVGVTSPQECQRKRLEFLREVELGTYAPPEARVKITVYRVADLWPVYLRAYRNEGGKDAGRLEIAWNHLKPMFEKLRVEEVSTDSVNQYIEARRAAGMENGTINRETAMLRAMFNHGTRVSAADGGSRSCVPCPAQRERAAERIRDRCRVCNARHEREGFMAALFDCGLV